MSKNILIVEDETVTSFEIESQLTKWGYNVVGTPKSGFHAIELVKDSCPDLVIMDISLEGEMDGIVAAEKIKGQLNVPVIFLTANSEDNTINRALKINPYGYIIKPYDRKELRFTVEMALYKHQMEEKLKRSEELYRNLSESSPDIIIVTDKEGRGLYANNAALKMAGVELEEFMNKKPLTFFSLEMARNHDYCPLNNSSDTSGTVNEEIKIPINDQEVCFDCKLVPLKSGEKDEFYMIIARDITERKLMEEKIQKSLQEKEILIKEIHHRVKNNLMVISSLLNLQSRYIKDKEVLGVFKESQNRARTMALIHEKLYQSSDLKRINFGDYVRTLSQELFQIYTPDRGRIKLNMSVDDLMLDVNTTVPLGLIVNELVSNSLKHAFYDGRNGEINIHFHKKEEDYILKVNDNGVGFPHDLDFKNTESLGLQIVNTLTNQIDGDLAMDRIHGTKFEIKFKELDIQKL